jgi:histidine ammonia-lyase
MLQIDGKSLTLENIEKFLTTNQKVKLTSNAKSKVKKARKLIDKWVNEDSVIYGVTTGFGEFANVKISYEDLENFRKI